jgi:hypothetical protein
VLVRVGGFLFLVALAVWLYCVLDAITADRDRVRALPKGVWVAIVLLTFEIGAVAWLVWGRPRGAESGAPARPRLGSTGRTAWPSRPSRPARPARPGDGGFGRSGPPAPDDDPEFLARLDRQAAADHEKLLGSWEEDLRRREDELRRDDREPDEPDGGPNGDRPPSP